MQVNWQHSQKPVYMAKTLLRHLYLEDLYIKLIAYKYLFAENRHFGKV